MKEDNFQLVKTGICKYYRKGGCKRGSSCRFQHPDVCSVFMKAGLKKFNKGNRGCDEQCGRLHPTGRMCIKALKTGKCSRGDCQYMHISGTKRGVKLQMKAPPANGQTNTTDTRSKPTPSTSKKGPPKVSDQNVQAVQSDPKTQAGQTYANVVADSGKTGANNNFLDLNSLGAMMLSLLTRMDRIDSVLHRPPLHISSAPLLG